MGQTISLNEIREKIKNSQVNNVQCDVNSYCSSRCWYCPVRYYQRHDPQTMTIEMFGSILDQLEDLKKEGLVKENYTLWLSSYNDILIDPLLPERLEALRQRKLMFSVLTNGVGLLNTVDLLHEYSDVIAGYSINLPAGHPDSYAKFTLNSEETFARIIEGIQRLYEKSPDRYGRCISIMVNGAYEDPVAKAQTGYDLPPGSTNLELAALKGIFPYLEKKIGDARPLCDRAGYLARIGVLNNSVDVVRKQWKLPMDAESAKDCGNSRRNFEWIHISSSAKMYLCCNDFWEQYEWGDLNKNTVKEILQSEQRVIATQAGMRELCLKCWFAR
jgi:sulfatase maturation enzyme AslB (radical SAM superfamily)